MTDKKLSYALKPDAQAFDEIKLIVVPRYKSSELSGSEWRISINAEFYRNGQKVHEAWCGHSMDVAVALLASRYYEATDNGKGYFAGDGIHCDQEGCHEKAKFLYRIKKDFCSGAGKCGQEKKRYSDEHRCFCEKHATRGDSDLKDNDENYELINVL